MMSRKDMTVAQAYERAYLWLALCMLHSGGEETVKRLLYQIADDAAKRLNQK